MTSRVVVPPIDEPVTLDQAKVHLRVTHDDEDGLIGGLISAAREHVEAITRRALMPQTRELVLDGWRAGGVKLPGSPLRSVESVAYRGASGSLVTVAPSGYQVDADSEPGRLHPAHGTSWPSARRGVGAVRIRYVAGYENADAVPATLKQAMLFLIGHWYANREAVVVGSIAQDIPMTVSMLLAPQRVLEFS